MLNPPVTDRKATAMSLALAVRIISTMFASLDKLEFFGALDPITRYHIGYMRTLTLDDLATVASTPTPANMAGLAYAVSQVEREGGLDRVQADAVAVATAWLDTYAPLFD